MSLVRSGGDFLKRKSNIIIGMLLVACIVLISILIFQGKSNTIEDTYSRDNYRKIVSNYIEGNENDFDMLINQEKDFYLLVGKETCIYCQEIVVEMDKVIDDKIDMHYLDSNKPENEGFLKENEIAYVPLLLHFKIQNGDYQTIIYDESTMNMKDFFHE